MLEPALQAIIEDLCHDGCKAVSHYIKDIESGDIPHQMAHLQTADQAKILTELKAIMAVYDRCGS